MDPLWLWIFVASAYMMTRVAEHRLHRRNYQFLTDSGAEELIPRRMRFYYRLTIAVVPAVLFEYLVLRQPVFWEMIAGGLGMIALGTGLRQWAIYSLGEFWSMRCLALQGIPQVRRGPYRFIRNPEYLSRLLDGAGLCLMMGARFSLLAFVSLAVLATLRISNVERRQLRELSGFSGR